MRGYPAAIVAGLRRSPPGILAMNERPTETYDPGAIRRALVARAPLIVGLALVGAAAAFLGSSLSNDIYEARAVMLIKETPVDARLINGAFEQAPATNPRRMRSATVDNLKPAARQAASDLGDGVSADDVLATVRLEPDLEKERAYLYGEDSDPELAASYANAMAAGFEKAAASFDQREIATALTSARSALRMLPPNLRRSRGGKDIRDQIARLRSAAVLGTDRVLVLRRAKIPDGPKASDSPARAAVAGGVGGALIGIVFALAPLLRRFPGAGERHS